MITVG